ncbi:DUF1796 family putative cysteine peptidase [Paenibacillus xanthanilyticus]|uniref:DUF1796 family putative cysteine peptidase n=1 Tax=Paenibacillus xanthanilyticus TaxID=1783531 RepID=A0ABV8KDH3_9BACL
MLTLEQIRGVYDAIYSLGHNCLPGVQMTRSGLRRNAGPIDWMGSPALSGVTRALHDRFAHFMKLSNLSVVGIDPNAGCYLVKDLAYGIVSNHDFPVGTGTADPLLPYPAFSAKMKRRTDRMLDDMQTKDRLLFIRAEGTYPELFELSLTLQAMVRGEFRILFVQHGPVSAVTPMGWHIPHVCALQIPLCADPFHDNDSHWRALLAGITHR